MSTETIEKEEEEEGTLQTGLQKVVVVVGPTGTGKSRLALELAAWLGRGAAVVNADAMQCYAGLATLTNQASAAERARVPHHCLAHRDALAPAPYDVRHWTADADRAIATIAARGGTPVVVGGTHYYIEALLWRNVLSLNEGKDEGQDKEKDDDEDKKEETEATATASWIKTLEDKSNEEVHAMLEAVDPVTAARLHPNNRRKVVRALQVARATGQPLSAHLHAQRTGPRRPHARYSPLVLWVDYADLAALDARLDARVDAMAAGPMFAEIAALRRRWRATHAPAERPDFERGLFQAIGLRQLWDAVPEDAVPEDAVPEDAGTEGGAGTMATASDGVDAALAAMKQATRRYARQQRRWLANRLARTHGGVLQRLVVHDPAHWDAEVLAPAQAAVTEFLRGGPLRAPEEAGCAEEEDDDGARVWTPRTCAACKRTLHGDAEWAAHTRSMRHKTNVKRARLAAQRSSSSTQTESPIE